MSESNRRRGPHLVAALTGLVGNDVLESLLYIKKPNYVEQNVNDKAAQKSKAKEKRRRKQLRNLGGKPIAGRYENGLVFIDESAKLTEKDWERLKDVFMPKDEEDVEDKKEE